jgi:hypothetical protein
MDFRGFPAGNGVFSWSFQPVPTGSGRRNDRPGTRRNDVIMNLDH